MSSARAGWYVDPSTGTNLRYWNGSTWTDEVAPLPNEPMHSGPVDLFGAAAKAAESATATAEMFATAATVEASGIDLVDIGPEPLEREPEQVETEPDRVDSESDSVGSEPEQVETEPEQVEAAPEPTRPESGPAEAAAEPVEVAAVPEPEPEPAGDNLAGDEQAEALSIPALDPEVEQTLLTRRELRARRGTLPVPDDTPKHLPPMTPPVAVPIDVAPEPVEEVEFPAQEPLTPLEIETATGDDPVARRRRIIRLSVLLGILAVTSSVAVLTAGTL